MAESSLAAVLWPIDQAADAVRSLCAQSGVVEAGLASQPMPAAPAGVALDVLVEAAAQSAGAEAVAVETTYAEIDELVGRAAPAILSIGPRSSPTHLAVLLRAGRRRVVLIAPDGSPRTLPRADLVAALRAPLEARVQAAVTAQVARAGRRTGRARARIGRALTAERLASAPIEAGFLVQPGPGATLRHRARRAGVFTFAGWLTAVSALHSLCFVAGWGVLGGLVFGKLEPRWLVAWLALVGLLLPIRAGMAALGRMLATRVASVYARRLLDGTLAIDPDSVRELGLGDLIGRHSEASSVAVSGLAGVVAGIRSGFDLLAALVVLAIQADSLLAATCLLAAVGALGLAVRRFARRRADWSTARLEMTLDLVEKMVGHRTRRVQEMPELRHVGETEQLARYDARSRAFDRAALVVGVVPGAFLVVGLGALAPALLAGISTASLAAALGAVLLAAHALERLAAAAVDVVAARLGVAGVASFLTAGTGTIAAPGPFAGDQAGEPLVHATDLTYRYPGRTAAVGFAGDWRIDRGDRLLVVGASGAGKSTLSALLSGARRPTSGTLRVDGHDAGSFAGRWPRRVAVAPQFHENLIYSNTFIWNLLMGRVWPYQPEDVERAEQVCRDVGLGEVLDRMPARLERRCSATPAGSCHTAGAAGCSWRAPCCKGPTSSSSTRASPPSTPTTSAWSSTARSSTPPAWCSSRTPEEDSYSLLAGGHLVLSVNATSVRVSAEPLRTGPRSRRRTSSGARRAGGHR